MAQQIEATIDGMLEKLRNELPEAINALNAEVDDGYLIEQPVAITFGPRVEMQFPHVSVSPLGTEGADASGRIFWNHSIAVTVWLQDFDQEGLVRKLIRFQRVIREVVMRRRHPGPTEFDGSGYGLQHTEDEYSEPFLVEGAVPDGQTIAYATSLYAVQQQQDLP